MYISFPNIRIAGSSAAVPARSESVDQFAANLSEDIRFQLKRVALVAGLRERRVAPADMYAGDLGYAAARQLIDSLEWASASIGSLWFVTLTPDFFTPQTGMLIAARLGLGKDCVVTDVLDGCPGLTHAAMLACGLLNSTHKRAILICGSVYSKAIRKGDVGNAVLFGDAVGAVGLEYAESAPPISFQYLSFPDTDFAIAHYGTGFKPVDGKERGLEMKGGKVTDFCRNNVAASIRDHIKKEGLEIADIDEFYFHQPNRMLLGGICRDLGLEPERLPTILPDYANCSGACLPLLLGKRKPATEPATALFCSFGTGLRICSMIGRLEGNMPVSIIEQG